MSDTQIEIDIPCDVQDEDELGMPYALLSEARDPSRIVPGAIVITADAEDPVFARVHSLTQQGTTRWSTSSCCLVIHASTRTPFSGRISCPPERGLPRSGDPGRARQSSLVYQQPPLSATAWSWLGARDSRGAALKSSSSQVISLGRREAIGRTGRVA